MQQQYGWNSGLGRTYGTGQLGSQFHLSTSYYFQYGLQPQLYGQSYNLGQQYGSQALLSAMQQQYTQNALQRYVFEAQLIGADPDEALQSALLAIQPHGGFEAKCGSGPGDERPQEGNPQVHPPVAPQDLLRGFSMAPSILIPELPRFVPPMLAKPGAPFDSSEHLFEIKWDGTRVLA